MNPQRRVSKLLAMLLAISCPLASSGCSLIFAHGPPKNHEAMEYFDCTQSNTAPILDVIVGSLNLLTAVGTLIDSSNVENPRVVIVSGLAWTPILAFSAINGFHKTNGCRAAKLILVERQAQNRALDAQVGVGTVQAVVISPGEGTLRIGERLQLFASAHTSSGADARGGEYKWSSSNDAIASVNNAGLVTAHAPGSVVISANRSNVVGTANITVSLTR
jgi:hypothetical protein